MIRELHRGNGSLSEGKVLTFISVVRVKNYEEPMWAAKHLFMLLGLKVQKCLHALLLLLQNPQLSFSGLLSTPSTLASLSEKMGSKIGIIKRMQDLHMQTGLPAGVVNTFTASGTSVTSV